MKEEGYQTSNDGFSLEIGQNPDFDPATASDLDTIENSLSLVMANINQKLYGLNIQSVREVIRMVEITSVPEAPLFIEGVFNLRGEIIPAVDLRRRLGETAPEFGAKTRIIICEIDNVTVGLIVDQVTKILRLPTEAVQPPPTMVEQVNRKFVSGVATLKDQLLIVLDLREVLTDLEKAAIKGSND